MTVQDLPRFAAFEEWGFQLAPGRKPKAKQKDATAPAAPQVTAVDSEWKLLRRVIKLLGSAGCWIVDAVWENIAEWFRDLRRRIITLVLGALMGGGYAHEAHNLFGLKYEARPPAAANDNIDNWKTEVHPAPRAQGRSR